MDNNGSLSKGVLLWSLVVAQSTNRRSHCSCDGVLTADPSPGLSYSYHNNFALIVCPWLQVNNPEWMIHPQYIPLGFSGTQPALLRVQTPVYITIPLPSGILIMLHISYTLMYSYLSPFYILPYAIYTRIITPKIYIHPYSIITCRLIISHCWSPPSMSPYRACYSITTNNINCSKYIITTP